MKQVIIKQFQRLSCFFLFCGLAVLKPDNLHAQEASQVVYNGVATTTVQLANIYGQAKGTFTYKTNVQIIIGPPRKGLNNQESNPFHFAIQSQPLVNAPGEVSFWSSLPAEGTVFQYWQFTSVSNNSWQCVLNNNHTQEAIALNLITVPTEIAPNLEMNYTVALMNGTKMTGQIDNGLLKIAVEGNSTSGNTPFRTEIQAQRSE